ncbi:DNA-binding GntR family transcriptional regulator [Lipingzhangella halophila]|uniref:DNA-binding GntR family transcriptional regulator n=1 Tax=Lipingzhangella halophila TaxID=1783352 RepID=A0A7W7W5W8_9ACTN|nr:GntR family transcriptional regulator [Lipingzhangella halophila]MBB4934245.1 DNA-binding GntR family transcriptional regulator [Lipingzhangella halophila]
MAGETSKTESVYQRLKSEIEELHLPPGTRLSEVVAAGRIGASRTPVREAIRRLAREGLVDSAPGEVARVAPISLGGVRALFEFRMVLEPAAARMVARDGSARPELLRPFRDLLAEFESVRDTAPRANQAADAGTFYALAERFDQELIAATPNEPLARTIADQRGQTTRLRNVAHSDTGHLVDSLGEHLRMCAAIGEARPGDAAEELTRHLGRTLRTILDTLARGPVHGTQVEVEA